MSSTTGTVLFFVRLLLGRLDGVSDEVRGFFALMSGPERSPPCSEECVLFLPSGVVPEDMEAEREGLCNDRDDVTSPLIPQSRALEYLS